MEFSSFQEFIAMGRNGFYVWLAYGFTAVVVIANIFQPLSRLRQLRRQHQQDSRRRSAKLASVQSSAGSQ